MIGSGSGAPRTTPEDPPAGRPELAALRLADRPERWRALGFEVDDARIWLAGVSLELGAEGHGIVGWRLRGLNGALDSLDGLATEVDDAGEGEPALSGRHPNGAVALDHVVVMSSDFDRTAGELSGAGMPLRRIRQAAPGVRQGFRRLGAAILELVEAPELPPGPSRFWGFVIIAADLDALAVRLGDRLGTIKPAVQPGRRIATLRSSAGLGQAMAFMSPEPSKPSATLG